MMKLTKSDERLLNDVVKTAESNAPLRETFAAATWVNPQHIGIYRRIVNDDPRELACGLILQARSRWNKFVETRPRTRYRDDLWREILLAAAAHDWDLLHTMAAYLPDNGQGPADGSCDQLIYEKLVAFLHRNELSKGHRSLKEISKKPLAFTQSVVNCATALHSCDPTLFATKLSDFVATTRKSRGLVAEDRLISVYAHGFWELAYRISPELVDEYNVSSGLPWDSGFHEFMRTMNANEIISAELSGSRHICELIRIKAPAD